MRLNEMECRPKCQKVTRQEDETASLFIRMRSAHRMQHRADLNIIMLPPAVCDAADLPNIFPHSVAVTRN